MSKINKSEIPQNHCHTELVYQRINKKLGVNFLNGEIEALIKKVVLETTLDCFKKKEKNYYISSKETNSRITINSTTFRVITVDKIIK
ncbi:DUF3781 domain-containing protein [Polaribacter filamentus]|uniref:DUF3781 domain-containing protein n=1 Tax=Polaribacter filamentus TaxID=53483 RepID=UPI000CF22541|nr:DUF3781 domain-containing protein [Polaribacter filamentus]